MGWHERDCSDWGGGRILYISFYIGIGGGEGDREDSISDEIGEEWFTEFSVWQLMAFIESELK